MYFDQEDRMLWLQLDGRRQWSSLQGETTAEEIHEWLEGVVAGNYSFIGAVWHGSYKDKIGKHAFSLPDKEYLGLVGD